MTHLYAFGCPHSGTTYLWRLLQWIGAEYNRQVDDRRLEYMEAIEVFRLTEANPIHPCIGVRGLLGLAMSVVGTEPRTKVVLVRIVRDPVQIFESFYAKRLPEHGAYMQGVNDDERIMEFIVTERANVIHQKKDYEIFKEEWDAKRKAHRGWPFNLVEVQYEALDTNLGQVSFADRLDALVPGIGQYTRIYLADSWKTKPIRHGRLKMGITETLLPPGLKENIEKLCSSL